eukprot:5825711-Alexandrium_andersonii.AAC.1
MGAAEHHGHGGHRQQPDLHASGIHHDSEGVRPCPGIHAADPGGIGTLAAAGHAAGNPGTAAARGPGIQGPIGLPLAHSLPRRPG